MSNNRFYAIDVMSKCFEVISREKELFLTLTLFLSFQSIIFIWPPVEFYMEASAGWSLAEIDPDEFAAVATRILDYFKFWIWPYLLFMVAALTVWSRASIKRTENSVNGSFGVFVIRSLFSFWRFLCGLGWISVFLAILILAFAIFYFGLTSLAINMGLDPAVYTTLVLLIFVPFYALGIFGGTAIFLALSISLHGEARDIMLPLHRSLKYLKGNFLRANGLLIALGFSYQIVFLYLFATFGAFLVDAPFWAQLLGTFLLFSIWIFSILYWVTYGAIFSNLVVPNIAENEGVKTPGGANLKPTT